MYSPTQGSGGRASRLSHAAEMCENHARILAVVLSRPHGRGSSVLGSAGLIDQYVASTRARIIRRAWSTSAARGCRVHTGADHPITRHTMPGHSASRPHGRGSSAGCDAARGGCCVGVHTGTDHPAARLYNGNVGTSRPRGRGLPCWDQPISSATTSRPRERGLSAQPTAVEFTGRVASTRARIIREAARGAAGSPCRVHAGAGYPLTEPPLQIRRILSATRGSVTPPIDHAHLHPRRRCGDGGQVHRRHGARRRDTLVALRRARAFEAVDARKGHPRQHPI